MTDTGVSLTGATASRMGRATLRVERTTRERHNVTPPAGVGPAAFAGAVVWVVEVTGDLSPGSGLHPAKLYRVDNEATPIAWVEVTGAFYVKPLPGQSLADGDVGVALLVGVHDGAPVYSLRGGGTGAPSSACDDLHAIRAADCVQFSVGASPGTAVVGGWDATEGGWLADDLVPTGDGDSALILVRDSVRRLMIRVEGETTSWHIHPTGVCVSGWWKFVGEARPNDDPNGAIEAYCDADSLVVWVKCIECHIGGLSCCPGTVFPSVMYARIEFTGCDCTECRVVPVYYRRAWSAGVDPRWVSDLLPVADTWCGLDADASPDFPGKTLLGWKVEVQCGGATVRAVLNPPTGVPGESVIGSIECANLFSMNGVYPPDGSTPIVCEPYFAAGNIAVGSATNKSDACPCCGDSGASYRITVFATAGAATCP